MESLVLRHWARTVGRCLVPGNPIHPYFDRARARISAATAEAANGREALDLAAATPKLDAVLTDLAMPELGGRELARRLRMTHPDLPVVYMSGSTNDDLVRRGLLESGVPFLEQPLSPAALARTMRQALDGDTSVE